MNRLKKCPDHGLYSPTLINRLCPYCLASRPSVQDPESPPVEKGNQIMTNANAIESLLARIQKAEAERDRYKAESEGRRRVLLIKEEELSQAWKRAERAEAEIDEALKILNPTCKEETLVGAIRNLQQAHRAEQDCAVMLEKKVQELKQLQLKSGGPA